MPFRVTDASTSRTMMSRIAVGKERSQIAQERIATGKRINRPSDDPAGAETALRLRSSQAAVAQFQRNTDASRARLMNGDSALDSYERALDRVGALIAQGVSDSTPPEARRSIAAEIEGLREHVLNIANGRTVDGYTFGGSAQDAPPFDPTTFTIDTAAVSASAPQVQIEPETPPITVGVTAATVFTDVNGTIFDTLTAVAAALRGTGDPVADDATLDAALGRIASFEEQANVSRTTIGANLDRVEIASERLTNDTLLLATALTEIEGADITESAIAYREAENALEAIYQMSSQSNRRSLLDFLG